MDFKKFTFGHTIYYRDKLKAKKHLNWDIKIIIKICQGKKTMFMLDFDWHKDVEYSKQVNYGVWQYESHPLLLYGKELLQTFCKTSFVSHRRQTIMSFLSELN